MSDLFDDSRGALDAPLADRMRPRTLDEVVGQDHIVGKGRLLRRSIQADRISSILLYGPPGTGKTSLARVVAASTKSAFESLNAVLTGVKDVREAIDRANERRRLYGKKTILFVDEVHRWNKAQQDALLPWVENGTVVLIGATTENPFFEVNRALVSRSRIFQLKALTAADLRAAAERALTDAERGYGKWSIAFEPGALEHLIETANGDARSLLNALELAVETTPEHWPPPVGSVIQISFAAAEESIQKKAVLYDRDGDYHFDTISAFIKSLRGSDPDAALYWLAKMVRAGEDPGFIFRRMLISAGEDVGMADPHAIVVVQACAAAFDRVGFPEGNFQLAQAALYLATAPKSNTALAFFDAMEAVEKEDAEIPNHLRDDNRDKEGFGHGEGYVYPHAFREHWAAQRYLPKALTGRIFYTPSESGFEGNIRAEVLRKREIQTAVVLDEIGSTDAPDDEVLTYAAPRHGREAWLRRLESGRSGLLLRDRDRLFSALAVQRHHRVLAAAGDDGLLVWEAFRRVPEGLAAAAVRSEENRRTLARIAAALDVLEQPRIVVADQGANAGLPTPEQAQAEIGTDVFDSIVAREPWRSVNSSARARDAFGEWARAAAALLPHGGRVALLVSVPNRGERLSRLIGEAGVLDGETVARVKAAEDAFFADPAQTRLAWSQEDLAAAFRESGFQTTVLDADDREERRIGERELSLWFDPERSSWGAALRNSLGDTVFDRLREAMRILSERGPLDWKRGAALLVGEKTS